MIKVNLYYNTQGNLWRFKLSGHAGYANPGEDIVCAAVSMLVLNTINSIESFTSEPALMKNANKGYIDCTFENIQNDKGSKEAILLLKSMVLGLQSVGKEYKDYIKINIHQGGE